MQLYYPMSCCFARLSPVLLCPPSLASSTAPAVCWFRMKLLPLCHPPSPDTSQLDTLPLVCTTTVLHDKHGLSHSVPFEHIYPELTDYQTWELVQEMS